MTETRPSVSHSDSPLFFVPDIDYGGFAYDRPNREFAADYSGALRRFEFLNQSPQDQGPVNYSAIPVDEEVFEWMDIIESIQAARNDGANGYTFAEIGAGYARWGVRAHLLATRAGLAHVRLILAEAEPRHLEWLSVHLTDNGIRTDDVTLLPAAVAAAQGNALFYVQMPAGSLGNSPGEWYGQALTHAYEKPIRETKISPWGTRIRQLLSRHPIAHDNRSQKVALQSGWVAIRVRTVRLRDCLPSDRIVDLADFDIQGAELDAITESIDVCNSQIRMLHIGTHSAQIEAGLREVMTLNGWLPVRDHPLGGTHPTQFGPVKFVDGVQTWINPRLRSSQYQLRGSLG